ncbi:MAG TPA: hypothetical protein VES93_09465 [Ornithinibacter sp.]|nr:hypothetical protein [Ornithinibacter sp.]
MARPVKSGRAGVPVPLAEVVLGFWTVALAAFVIIGADLMWAVALGDTIRRDGAVPAGLPFASAPQLDWPNPAVLAQLFLSVVHGLGWWALPALQLVLVAATLLVVLADASRMGAGPGRSAAVVSVVVVGGASAFVLARFPSLSLVPFVVLVLLLRRQEERPGRAVWVVPPLLIVWGNLHGGVLVGLGVLGVWVLAGRSHTFVRRALVGVASLSALVLTSAGLRTPEYYLGVLGNEAAVRRTGMWAAPDLTNPLDVAMVLCAVALLALAARSLVRWEWVVVVAVAVATVSAARHGVWLLLFLAPVAAAGRHRRAEIPADQGREPVRAARHPAVLLVVGAVTAGLVAAVLANRSEQVRPPGHELVAALRGIAGPLPVLAIEPEAETFAQAGITVWAANPVDAFPREVQGAFIDFLDDCRVPDAGLSVAVAGQDCAEELTREGWVVVRRSGELSILTRPS